MKLDYDLHPSFATSAAAWTLPAGPAEEFEAAYRMLARVGRGFPEAAQAQAQARCERSLQAVFAALAAQAASPRERMFIDELFEHALHLLGDDLRFHCRPIEHGRRAAGGTPAVLTRTAALATDRYYLDRIDAGVVAEMLRVGAPALRRFRDAAAAGETSRDDLSQNTGDIVRTLVKLMNDEFGRMGVNDSVTLYMGQPMQVAGLALELSVPAATWWRNAYTELGRAPDTLYFHIDESAAFPKAIVYLTDVAGSSGPTGVAPGALDELAPSPLQFLVGRIICKVGRRAGSALAAEYRHQYHQIFGCPEFRADFMRLPHEMRWNSHLGWDVVPDSPLERYLCGAERKVTGPAGTCLVFDGTGLLHRGGMVATGERIALQVIFAPKPQTGIVRRIARRARRLFNGMVRNA